MYVCLLNDNTFCKPCLEDVTEAWTTVMYLDWRIWCHWEAKYQHIAPGKREILQSYTYISTYACTRAHIFICHSSLTLAEPPTQMLRQKLSGSCVVTLLAWEYSVREYSVQLTSWDSFLSHIHWPCTQIRRAWNKLLMKHQTIKFKWKEWTLTLEYYSFASMNVPELFTPDPHQSRQ